MTVFQVKCIALVTATQPYSQCHHSRSLPNTSVLESLMSSVESSQVELLLLSKGLPLVDPEEYLMEGQSLEECLYSPCVVP